MLPFYVGIGTNSRVTKAVISKYPRAHTKSHRSKHWANIVNKVGYKVEIMIESNNYEMIKKKESEFIKIYGRRDLGTGILINKTNGGEGLFGAEQRLFLSILHKGKKVSDRTKNKISLTRTGMRHSPESRRRMSESHKGVPLSKNAIEAASEKRRRPVIRLLKNGDYVSSYKDIITAASELKCDCGDITKCCRGSNKSAAGFVWKYKSEYEQFIASKQFLHVKQ